MEFERIVLFDTKKSACNPFVKTMGKPTVWVAEDAMVKRVVFHNLKMKMKEAMKATVEQEKKPSFLSFFSTIKSDISIQDRLKNVGIVMDPNYFSVLDRAVGLGMELDTKAVLDSFKETLRVGESKAKLPFFKTMKSVNTLARIKILESNLLYLFQNEIDREAQSGKLNLMTSIQSATQMLNILTNDEKMYSVEYNIDHLLANITMDIERDDAFTSSIDKKNILLNKYCNLPFKLMQHRINNVSKKSVDEKDELIIEYKEIIDKAIKANKTISRCLDNKKKSVQVPQQKIVKKSITGEEYYIPNKNYIDAGIR